MLNFTLKWIKNVSSEFLTVFLWNRYNIFYETVLIILFQILTCEEKKKDSVETLNELEGDFSAALFHRSRIILS